MPVPFVVLLCACTDGGEVVSGAASSPGQDGFAADREHMVAEQIAARDVRDPRVLAAMRAVPRHLFVPPDLQRQAYLDRPLPIGYGQTISQPYIVALMTAAGAAGRGRPRARSRHRIRVSGGRAVAARLACLHRRDRGADCARAERTPEETRLLKRHRADGRRIRRLAGQSRRSTSSSSPRRPITCRRRFSRSSSAAAGSSFPSARSPPSSNCSSSRKTMPDGRARRVWRRCSSCRWCGRGERHRRSVAEARPRARSTGMNRAVASTVCRWSLRGADSSPSCMTMMSPADARVERRRKRALRRARAHPVEVPQHPAPANQPIVDPASPSNICPPRHPACGRNARHGRMPASRSIRSAASVSVRGQRRRRHQHVAA